MIQMDLQVTLASAMARTGVHDEFVLCRIGKHDAVKKAMQNKFLIPHSPVCHRSDSEEDVVVTAYTSTPRHSRDSVRPIFQVGDTCEVWCRHEGEWYNAKVTDVTDSLVTTRYIQGPDIKGEVSWPVKSPHSLSVRSRTFAATHIDSTIRVKVLPERGLTLHETVTGRQKGKKRSHAHTPSHRGSASPKLPRWVLKLSKKEQMRYAEEQEVRRLEIQAALEEELEELARETLHNAALHKTSRTPRRSDTALCQSPSQGTHIVHNVDSCSKQVAEDCLVSAHY